MGCARNRHTVTLTEHPGSLGRNESLEPPENLGWFNTLRSLLWSCWETFGADEGSNSGPLSEYAPVTEADAKEIVTEHILAGRVVDLLVCRWPEHD